ncbi:MAG TPA: TolC family protein [Geobacteraceae bacterium]|nr:TolC family protein [Geobacteraceae bacterium]
MSRLHLLVLFAPLILLARAEAETLTLQECLKKAAAANHELKVTAFDEKIAEGNIGVAKSGFLPHLNFQGGYTVQQDPQAMLVQGTKMETQQAEYGFFSVTADQILYDFGRTSSRFKQAQALRDATSFNHTARTKDIFLQVITAYYGILEYRKLVQAAQDEIVQMADHLRIAKNLYDQGVVTRNDLLQAEVQLANSKQRGLMEANRLENGWLYLNYLLGQQSSYRADLEESVTSGTVTTIEDFPLTNRAEVMALRKGIEADEHAVKESRSFYFPELFARLGVEYVQNKKVEEQAILYATVGLKINLFDGLATTSRYRQAIQSRMQNDEKLHMLESQIRLEYETACNDAQTAEERIRAAEKAVTQGEENLRINKDRYQEHVGTATDVIDAQTLLTKTRAEYYRAVFDHQVAIARIKKAKGEL